MDGSNSFAGDMRLDKWLWAARLFKTRALAVQAIDAGQVRVNGARAKPSRSVHIGDTIAVTRASARIELAVKGLTKNRGSATVAATLYDETAESAAARAAQAAAKEDKAKHPGGRPTKRERRQLEQLIRG